MARKKLVANVKSEEVSKQVQLSNLVASYGEHKTQANLLDKDVKKENAEIKSLMEELKCKEYESGGYIVKYVIEPHENVNEEKLLEVLKKEYTVHQKLGIIKTKEYVDTDALETAVYAGNISKKILLEMDKCREVKNVIKLTIKKSKGEKE